MERIENRMVIDSEWDEIEYRLPGRRKLKRIMEEYEIEVEDIEGEGLEYEFV